jgi:hypothetical protein
VTVVLTITDNIGRTASASVVIRSSLAAASGVGALRPAWLGLLALLALAQLHRRRRSGAGPAAT